MIHIAIHRIVLADCGAGVSIKPNATEFQRGKPYGGSAPGEFDPDVVAGYFGHLAPLVHAAIDRAIATGAAKSKGGEAVVMDKRQSDDLLVRGTKGQDVPVPKGRTARTQGESMASLPQDIAQPVEILTAG